MKKITLLMLAAGSFFTMRSQTILSEDFTDPFNVTANNWVIVDNSTPTSGQSWTQGNQTGGNGTMPAYNGNADDYFGADFTAINGANPGTISAFLITPTLTIYNGAVLQFATRTLNQVAPSIFPDRLQVLMSQAGSSVIPVGATSVGTYTDMLLDINPNLNTNNASAVNNGSVNGYPFAWTVYNLPITGVTGTVTGRFAFRYFVTNGGIGGANSRLVGVDAVRFTLPCGVTVNSFTNCANASTTLTAMNGLPATTYSWSTSGTNSTTVVNPAATTSYTLYPSVNGSISCGNPLTATVTVASNLAINILTSSNNTVCSGQAATLTAVGPASSFTWASGFNILGVAPSITVSPTSATNYSVGAVNGSCQGGNFVTIAPVANPVVSLASTNTLLCQAGPSVAVSFTASGANTYFWVLGPTSTQASSVVSLNVAAQTPTTDPTYTTILGVIGFDANGCFGTDTFNLVVSKKPNISVAANPQTVCTDSVTTITANGSLNSYTWSATASTTVNTNVVTYTAPSTPGNKIITVVGTNTDGCTSNTAAVTVSVVICNSNPVSINKINGDGFEAEVFPNPFANELRLTGMEGHVAIYNALGQAVISAVVTEETVINTSELPKGAYILRGADKEGHTVKTIKLLKN